MTPSAISPQIQTHTKRYLIFYVENGLVENILKEWDGKKVTNKDVQLNVCKLVVMMHYGEVMANEVEKIIIGDTEVEQEDAHWRRDVPPKYSSL